MIKTTRLKSTQVPKNITLDLTPQVDGVTQEFDLPEKVYEGDVHYILFNGQTYRNDDNNTFYTISEDGMKVTTLFDEPPRPGAKHVLQLVKTETDDGIDGGDIATEGYVDTKVAGEADAREGADEELQSQIDAITVASDVTDVVGTHAELDAYDTSKLKDNDIIKVLTDETYNGAIYYYRWGSEAEVFTAIGSEGPYYTKSQADSLLNAKQDTLTAGSNVSISGDTISATDTTYTAGANISIDSDNVISATDTTYSNFVGTDGVDAGTAGLVPAPVTTDAGKFLKADGTWGTVSGGIDPSTTFWGQSVVDGVVDGDIINSIAPSNFTIAYEPNRGSRGALMSMTSAGQFIFMTMAKSGGVWFGNNVGSFGANIACFKAILSQDSRTPIMPTEDNEYTCKAYVDKVGNTLATSAPTTATVGVLGQLYTDTTAMHTYQCTAIDATDPDNPVYTWTQRW